MIYFIAFSGVVSTANLVLLCLYWRERRRAIREQDLQIQDIRCYVKGLYHSEPWSDSYFAHGARGENLPRVCEREPDSIRR